MHSHPRAYQLDKIEVATWGLPPLACYNASEAFYSNASIDEAGAGAHETEGLRSVDAQQACLALEQQQQKVLRITEQIQLEQEAREKNVAEYLLLAHNSNKDQTSRIKKVFERKNQKSAKNIRDLQKQLAHYNKKLKEIHQHGFERQPKDVLVNMQQGVKDIWASVQAGTCSFAGGMEEQLSHTAEVTKPKELVSLILKKISKDTIPDRIKGCSVDITLASSPEHSGDDVWSSDSMTGSHCVGAQGGVGMLGPDRLDGHNHLSTLETLLEGLQEMKASQAYMKDAIKDMKNQLQSDYSYMKHSLLEERFRYELLEEQLNDLTELHHDELANFIQALASTEEKVAYQSEESFREMEEAVNLCMDRLTNLETQHQHQQTLHLERVENANHRALLGKLITVFLALISVVLVIISTLANFIAPLRKTKARGAATVLLLLLFILWKQWDFLYPIRDAYTEVDENLLYEF